MSARDDLAELIGDTWDAMPSPADHVWHILAGAILKAGWRAPARTVETEEELDALPDEAVIRDANGEMSMHINVPNKFNPGHRIKWWGDRLGYGENTPVLPATVLWEPYDGDE